MTNANVILHPGASPEPAAARAQRLMNEARRAADEHVRLLEQALLLVGRLSADVSQGGDVYPPGVRDVAKRIAGDAGWCAQTLDSIMTHVAGRKPAGEMEPR